MKFTPNGEGTGIIETKLGTFYIRVNADETITFASQPSLRTYEYVWVNGVEITCEMVLDRIGMSPYTMIRRSGGILAVEPTRNMIAKIWEVARAANLEVRSNQEWYQKAVKASYREGVEQKIQCLEQDIEQKNKEILKLRELLA